MQLLHDDDPVQIAGMRLLGRTWASGPIVSFLAAREQASGVAALLHVEVIELAESLDLSTRAAFDDAVSDLAALGDEGIASVVRFEVQPARAWLASEGPAGRTLAAVVHSSGALPEAAWQRLAASSLDVFSRLHAARIVHGRVDPESVWLTEDSVQWSNPGMGYAAWRAGLPGCSAWSSGIHGLAPEQLRGQPPSEATDLFALGCVLAFAGTGRMPWGDAQTPTATIVERLASDTPDTDGMAWHQKRIVAALTAKDPAFRASALADALAEFPELVSVLSEPDVPASAERDETRRGTDTEPPDAQVTQSAELAAVAQPVDLMVDQPTVGTLQDRPEPARLRHRWRIALLGGATVMGLAILFIVGRSATTTQVQSPPAPAGGSQRPTPANPQVVLSAKVDYRSDAIPDQEFAGGTEWRFDVCSADRALTSDAVLSKVALYRKTEDGWKRLSARAQVSNPGRCGGAKLNLVIPWSEPRPDDANTGQGWGTCTDYRVIIPETPSFAKTFVDMCVRTKVESA